MKNQSIWLDTLKNISFPSLEKSLEVDVLIIGGGILGISLLYELRNEKLNVALVERGEIGHGVTSKSTAKLNYLQGIVYSKIAQNVSEESARLYLESQLEGIKKIQKNIQKEHIDCDLQKVTSYLYGEKKDHEDIKKEYEFLKSHGIPVTLQEENLSVSDTYVFHPLKYVYHLASLCKGQIYENTLISELVKEQNSYVCQVNGYTVKAKYVVLACHYPFELFPFFLPIRTFIEKSYVMAKKTDMIKQETFITTYPNIVSKRFYDTYEIILKGSHNICNKLNTKKNFQKLTQEEQPDFLWSNEDVMTSDLLPFIGKLNENLLLGTGFNTWGMATSQIAAGLLKDILLGKENKYKETFDPFRSLNCGKIKQYPINLLSNLKGYTENFLCKKKSWYPENLTFSMIDGLSVAKYQDKEKEYMVYTTCPHALCTLTFNEIEKTWDCPCHASRFDITGKCIKGPSIYNITYKESSLK